MQNVMHIATNDGYTVQNDGQPCIMLVATHLLFAKDQMGGGLEEPPRAPGDPPPTPLREKTLVSRNDF